jgi:uncharacterized protein YjaG (DUF416 family)
MFKNIDEVKQFIEWASERGVARAKIGEVEFDIYSVKLLENVSQSQIRNTMSEPTLKKSDDVDEEEDLFWSAGG